MTKYYVIINKAMNFKTVVMMAEDGDDVEPHPAQTITKEELHRYREKANIKVIELRGEAK